MDDDHETRQPALAHGTATLEHLRPRSYRTATHVVFEGTEGATYRIDLRRLQSYPDVLRVVQWLVWQRGVTALSIDNFIRVACNGAGLGWDDRPPHRRR